MKRQGPILDYASPAAERKRDEARREAVEQYNQATFGERRPLVSTLARFGLFVVIVLSLFLPRGAVRFVDLLLIAGFVLWQVRRNGWKPDRWIAFRYPWRRW